MIFKKVPLKGSSKKDRVVQRQQAVTQMIKYITNPQSENANEKCTAIFAQNIEHEMFDDINDVIAEFKDLVIVGGGRSEDCGVSHYVISWPSHIKPQKEQAQSAYKELMAEMGLAKCKSIAAMHEDTEHLHMHIIVSRIDPVELKPVRVNGGYDVKAGIKAVQHIAKNFGWDVLPTKKQQAEQAGEPVKAKRKRSIKQQDDERLHGEKSIATLIFERCMKDIQRAKSWQELHALLAKSGVTAVVSGRGLSFALNGVNVKASEVHRGFSRAKLEKRLGKFVAPQPGLAVERPGIKVQESVLRESIKNDVCRRVMQSYFRERFLHEQAISKVKQSIEERYKQTLRRAYLYTHLYNQRDLTYAQRHGSLVRTHQIIINAQQRRRRSINKLKNFPMLYSYLIKNKIKNDFFIAKKLNLKYENASIDILNFIYKYESGVVGGRVNRGNTNDSAERVYRALSLSEQQLARVTRELAQITRRIDSVAAEAQGIITGIDIEREINDSNQSRDGVAAREQRSITAQSERDPANKN